MRLHSLNSAIHKRVLLSAMPGDWTWCEPTRGGWVGVRSFGNGMGTAIAIGGVLLYSYVKRYEREQKEKAAAAQ